MKPGGAVEDVAVDLPLDFSRRALLRGGRATAPPLRPPWALGEDRFADACTACDACIDACPERVLVRGGGGLSEFDPRRGECTFCGDCADACRAHAFGPVSGRPWTLRARTTETCLAVRGIVCSSCRDACGDAAIAFPPTRAVPRPRVDPDRCTGCGACVSACPAAAVALVRHPEVPAGV